VLFFCIKIGCKTHKSEPRQQIMKEIIMEIETENVAANTEEVAAPLIDNEETVEVDEGTEPEELVKPSESETPDVTTTQAFSQRLKEQTQKGIDAHYEKLYGESNNVHSEADYIKAYAEQEANEAEEERRSSLESNGYDPSVIEEYVNSNPTVKKAQELLHNQEIDKFKNDDNMEFLDYFKKENNRAFDGEKDILPTDIWELSKKYQNSLGKEGKSLVDAYQKHENSILKAKIADYEKGTQANETNAENASNSTGSVTGNGTNTNPLLTEEAFNKLSPREASKRWKEVRQLFKMK
jgi:hypothetical protein